ncbi:hypothetical protein L596_001209 [Steinernema carpocapsae]|uniref:Uncharacterized protein n=1 Tax=Steinernema carpocapsae TaxID=34508 RepID=A0A4V6YST5_STECR|nr:hypothetical protein L596_001209 [Steinernema carpocapsae]
MAFVARLLGASAPNQKHNVNVPLIGMLKELTTEARRTLEKHRSVVETKTEGINLATAGPSGPSGPTWTGTGRYEQTSRKKSSYGNRSLRGRFRGGRPKRSKAEA